MSQVSYPVFSVTNSVRACLSLRFEQRKENVKEKCQFIERAFKRNYA